MGKRRKHKTVHSGRPQPKRPRYQHPDAPRPANTSQLREEPPSKVPKKTKRPLNPQHVLPVIPFAPHHNILLVGEGDLSFAASLISHHQCSSLRAGVLEQNKEQLLEKYPHAQNNMGIVEDGGGEIVFGLDVTKKGSFVLQPKRRRKKHLRVANGAENGAGEAGNFIRDNLHKNSYEQGDDGEDAKAALKVLAPKAALLDRIIFNFPHVGGKSKDVNRQVRANQCLLVHFFERAIPFLAPGGRIVVTVFEGEPYNLWNVRDLGRNAGLAVERSFKFQASAYPRYRHARTLGVVRKGGWIMGKKMGGNTTRNGATAAFKEKKVDDPKCSESRNEAGYAYGCDASGREEDKWAEEAVEWEESSTAWRGEERPARSFVFIRKDDKLALKTDMSGGDKQPGRRKVGSSSDEDDSEDG